MHAPRPTPAPAGSPAAAPVTDTPASKPAPSPLADALDRARELFREARRRFPDWSEPPFDPARYAEILDIPIASSRSMPHWDAILIPGDRGFRILYNAQVRSEGRRRFSIAHEIAHTLFPDAATTVQRRAERAAYDTQAELDLERWCDQVAAELLMPAPVFRCVARDLGGEAQAVPTLAQTFQVSAAASAVRFTELSDGACAVGFFAWRHRPMVEALPPESRSQVSEARKYRVDSIYRNDAFPRIFMTGKSVPNTSVIYRCSLGTTMRTAEETFQENRRAQHRLRISAYPMHRSSEVLEPPRVCAVFRPRDL